MAISMLSAFKIIPWSDVLTAAPYIVQGAEKLWSIIARKPAPQRGNERVEEEASQSVSLSALDTRVHSLELLTAELHKEVLLSSELIKSLAQQNIQLVQAVDVLRVRTRILFGFCGVLAVVTTACVFLVVFR
ncbi:hypothetical protein ACFDAU_11545 [Sulfuriferula sp. GW1]|uniref:hypothetical protein n=1 Tax=Sulfuriferula sp. GW1 TaxID=3345111 RepID=UPI0039B0DEA7